MADDRTEPDVPSPEPTVVAGGHVAFGPDHSFTLQLVGEMRQSIGGLLSSVDTLVIEVKDHGKKIDGLSRLVWIAVGAFGVLAPIVTFVVTKAWDKLFP